MIETNLHTTAKREYQATIYRIRGLIVRRLTVRFFSKYRPGETRYYVAAVVAARLRFKAEGAEFRALRPDEKIYIADVSRCVRGKRKQIRVLYVSKRKPGHRLNKIACLWNARSRDRRSRTRTSDYLRERIVRVIG